MDVFKFGFKYWKKRLPIAIFCQLIGFAALLIGAYIPLIGKMIIDYVIVYQGQEVTGVGLFGFLFSGKYGDLGSTELFVSIAVVFCIIILLKIVLLYVRNNMFIRNGLKMENELREDTYNKLLKMSSSTILDYNTGDLLTILNSDTIMFKELYSLNILSILDSLFMLVSIAILLSGIHIFFLITPLLLSPILIYTLIKFSKTARKISGEIRDANAGINMVVSENISAVRLVRSFANEDYEMKKFEHKNQTFKNRYFKHSGIMAKYGIFFNAFRQIAFLASISIAAFLIINGDLYVGALAACSSYTIMMMDLISGLNNSFFNFQQQLVSGGRIKAFMDADINIHECENPIAMESATEVNLNNVNVLIGKSHILKDIDLTLSAGKKLGIMGGTGSGKTVLIKTLSRMHDISSGSLTINDSDLKDYSLEDVRQKFSYVFQDVFLFSNTIDSNIAFYDTDSKRAAVENAAKLALAHDFIEALPSGYDTIIGERGLGLSGGQKQRISIARALLKDSPVLVLDDCTSSLDMQTESRLLKNIADNYPDKTIVITAHRAATVKDCDEIIYLDGGKIIERGTFSELMNLNGNYAAIYKKQSSEMPIPVIKQSDIRQVYNG